MKSENETLQTKLEVEKESNKKIGDQKNKLLEEISAHKSISVSSCLKKPDLIYNNV